MDEMSDLHQTLAQLIQYHGIKRVLFEISLCVQWGESDSMPDSHRKHVLVSLHRALEPPQAGCSRQIEVDCGRPVFAYGLCKEHHEESVEDAESDAEEA